MNKALAYLAALLLLVAVPLPTVAAQDDQEREDEYKQEVEVSAERAEITVERELGDDIEAKAELLFDTSEGLFMAKAEQENESGESERTLEALLHQLVEYRDENGNDMFDPGEEVVSSWLLSEGSEEKVDGPDNGTVSWQALNVTDVESDDGIQGKHISGTAIFQTGTPVEQVNELLGMGVNRTFGVDLYVFPNVTSYNGTELTPMQVKIDFRISDYPYAADDTALALVLETKAESELEVDDDGGVVSPQQFADLEAQLTFDWDDEATVDGAAQPVGTSTLASKEESETEEDEIEREIERTFALSYARGDEIVHDPLMGAEIQSAEGVGFGDISETPGFPAWAALAAIGVAVGLVARRRVD